MKTKITLATVVGCLLAFGLGISSSAGMAASNYYDYTNVDKYGDNLWSEVTDWISSRLPFDLDDQPGFRWIETTSFSDPLDQKQNSRALTVNSIAHTQQRVVAPGGMFRRFEHGPAATFNANVPDAGTHGSQEPGRNLSLAAGIPGNLFVPDSDINWQVRSLNGNAQHNLYGRNLQLSLPQGAYEVRLRIGAYEERKVIDVRNGALTKPRFVANIGVLKASSSQLASWRVVRMHGTAAQHQVMGRSDSFQISGIVPAGEYEVIATINDASQRARVKVGRGATAVADLSVPTGRVNLVATLGNSPAMRPMSWKVYRLDGGRREVASPRRHSATLVVPPGHYEAIANLNGKERRREFTVMKGTDNSIVLAMD